MKNLKVFPSNFDCGCLCPLVTARIIPLIFNSRHRIRIARILPRQPRPGPDSTINILIRGYKSFFNASKILHNIMIQKMWNHSRFHHYFVSVLR